MTNKSPPSTGRKKNQSFVLALYASLALHAYLLSNLDFAKHTPSKSISKAIEMSVSIRTPQKAQPPSQTEKSTLLVEEENNRTNASEKTLEESIEPSSSPKEPDLKARPPKARKQLLDISEYLDRYASEDEQVDSLNGIVFSRDKRESIRKARKRQHIDSLSKSLRSARLGRSEREYNSINPSEEVKIGDSCYSKSKETGNWSLNDCIGSSTAWERRDLERELAKLRQLD